MTQRFEELYIPRGEHQQIVTYYKKLVVHMYQRLRALQGELEEIASDAGEAARQTKAPPAMEIAKPRTGRGNVVQVDFRRRRPSGA